MLVVKLYLWREDKVHGDGSDNLAPYMGSRDPLPIYLELYEKRNCELVTNEISVSPQLVLLIDKSWRSPTILGRGLGDCLSGHYLLAMCVFRAPGAHASPLLFLIITDVSLITWGARMLLPLGWARAETDIQWQRAGGRQRHRDCPDPDEDVTRSLRLIYSHDSPHY